MTEISPPPRRRAAPPAPPAPKKCLWDLPVVGGPKKLSMNGGFPVATEGQAIKGWPYRTGSELMGYWVREPNPKDFALTVGFHAWQARDGSLRYMGSFKDRETAIDSIRSAYARRQAADLQRVAPPARRRAPTQG